jgi:hypothetical protein
MRYKRWVHGPSALGCVLALGLFGLSTSWGQEASRLPTAGLAAGPREQQAGSLAVRETPAEPPTLPASPPSPDKATSPGTDADPPPITVVPQEQGADQKKKERPKSFWETNPPVRPTPRAGWFLILPTGPGYYSLWDFLTGRELEKPPVFPYSPISPMPGSFFDADFRYLENPENKQYDLFDCLHRIHFGDCWMFSTGGEERLRYMNEVDSRLSGRDNSYLLERTRVYGDLWYGNSFRAFVEFLDARSTHQTLNPLIIDQDHGDLLNAFIDVKLLDIGGKPTYVRVGRQEMLFGSQRLISPLDWANTRRTFEGVRLFRQGEYLDLDTFWVQPVIPNPTNFDSVDNLENFYGSWATYRPRKGETFDFYILDLNQARPVAVGANGVKGGFNCYTLGSRWAGDYQHILWDFEGMYQWGDWGRNQEISAGAYTTSMGYHFAQLPMNPQFWIAFDWASGNHDPNGRIHGTFNQLFPFGHYYFGYLDLVGRQNIEDFNMQLSLWPTKWCLALLQWHRFWLESARDSLYAASGAPLRTDPTGRAGRDVGDELDFFLNFHLDMHQDLWIGYSKLFAGDFIRRTGPGGSPELFYVQYSFRW